MRFSTDRGDPGVLGVDGCRGGWLAAHLTESLTFTLHTTFAELLETPARVIAVDMPIGLPDTFSTRGRECDRLARARLGRRAACVFPPPGRDLLDADDYQQVRGRGVSVQSFNLFAKIRELDHLMTSELQEKVRETHPELVFADLAGAPLPSKRTPEGLEQRRALLGHPIFDNPPPGSLAREDDLLDALALAFAARRGLRRLPEDPPRDARGLLMEICY